MTQLTLYCFHLASEKCNTKKGRCCITSSTCNISHSSLSQRVGADLQARVKGEFRALHQILQDEEACVLEQLRREQEEELEKVQRHLEAVELAVRELEDNLRVLKQASAATESVVLTEVRSLLKVAVKL